MWVPFLVEKAGVTVLVGVFDAGFELFGVENGDALEVGSIDFFLVLAALLPPSRPTDHKINLLPNSTHVHTVTPTHKNKKLRIR